MFAGLRSMGIRHLYAAVRRQQVADTHLKIGFRRIGALNVAAKPLRPAALAAKYLIKSPAPVLALALRLACRIPDALAGALLRLLDPLPQRGVVRLDLAAAHSGLVADLYARRPPPAVAQAWSAESVAARYRRGGARYTGFGVCRKAAPGAADQRLSAAVITRIVDRPEGIRAAVILDMVHDGSAHHGLGRALAAAEHAALQAGCEVIFCLAPATLDPGLPLRRRGYLRTGENYNLLLWTDKGQPADLFPADPARWHFAFADHDTF
jgi:hypothetical protein